MARKGWLLLPDGRPRHSWLRACWALENGAELLPAAHAGCTGAVLSDATRRLTRFGGRDGQPRSLASVYSCWVALFLQGRLRQRRCVKLDVDRVGINDVWSFAVCRAGAAVLVVLNGQPCLYEFDAHTGARVAVHRRFGAASIPFGDLTRVCVAPDGFVFALDPQKRVVHAATCTLTFAALYGAGGQLADSTAGLCAGTDFVAVSQWGAKQITVFSRSSTDVLRRIPTAGSPSAMCVLPAAGHIALITVEIGKPPRIHVMTAPRVYVMTATGTDVRSYGEFIWPNAMAASVYDELIVVDGSADHEDRRIVLHTDAATSTLTTAERLLASFHDGAVFCIERRWQGNWLSVWD
jgi:hypothetical protein